jgi:hypothetical protein
MFKFFGQSKRAFSNFLTMHVTEFVLRVTHTGRRPIAESVEIFSVTRMGVKIWGFKILAQKIPSSVELYTILDRRMKIFKKPGTDKTHFAGS